MNQAVHLLIIGSINMDQLIQADHFAHTGETIIGNNIQYLPGGKGANQAVAASRLGANVNFIGAVGNDHFGTQLLSHLQQENISTSAIDIITNSPTGFANIISARGENSIIVIPGANFLLSPNHIQKQKHLFQEADIVLCQMEIPLPCIEISLQLAKQFNKIFILNPAPAQTLNPNLIAKIDILTPNEHELKISLSSTDTIENTLARHPNKIIMTCGHKGVLHHTQNHLLSFPAYTVKAIDTTGAGDTFNGALARFWCLGKEQAISLACAAAALSTTKMGAQSAMPTTTELLNFLDTQQNLPQ